MISTFKSLKLAGLLIVAGVALSACQTTGSLSGQGDLKLSKSVSKYFLGSYMKEQYPLAFAVSEDGFYAAYRLCSGIKCRNPAGVMHKTILNCETRSNKKCNIFALRKEIVWTRANGQKITMDEVSMTAYGKPVVKSNAAADLSNISLCKKALSSDASSWSDASNAASYVAEAKNRDMKVNFCAKVTGRG